MQVQCLLVYKADRPQWTYRKVPKVSSFRSFDRIPFCTRIPQPFTYHMCAEDLTKIFVPNLPDGDLQVLKAEDTSLLIPLHGVDIVSCVLSRGAH